MIRKWFGFAVLIIGATLLLSLSSCGRDQQLESISVEPQAETFGASNIPVFANAGAQVQLRALGNYIHPPVTKDITNQVTWTSNSPQMMTVDASGLLTVTGFACGDTLISATVQTNSSTGGLSSSGAIVTGSMTGSVVCFTGSGGGQNNPALTLTFQGFGAGTVASSPVGLNCTSPNACVTQAFPVGTPVTLTATPTGGSSFGNWSGCDSPGTANPCTLNLSTDRNVSVSFN
jgi:Bacterial Ig-like domain (group 2)